MTLPIGGADMPVVISLYNALTGLAVAFEGYVLQQRGADHRRHGGRRGRHHADAADGQGDEPLDRQRAVRQLRPDAAKRQEIAGAQKPIEAGDVAAMMAYAERVVIVPGYGLAVAQAQHKVWELTQLLMKRGVKVKFAIHPVAGPHARAHERAAGRSRRALRPDRRHGRHQPRVPDHRRVAGDRRQRRGQPGRQDRSGFADLRHADPGRGRTRRTPS